MGHDPLMALEIQLSQKSHVWKMANGPMNLQIVKNPVTNWMFQIRVFSAGLFLNINNPQ